MDYIIDQLDKKLHDRNSFDCGIEALNEFLKNHAGQNQLKGLSKTYVAVVTEQNEKLKKIFGYYTLSAGSIVCDELPASIKSKLPKHPVPIARIGRLAVDKNYKNQGIGGFILYDALSRVLEIAGKVGIYAVVVDAKNQKAKNFYIKYGFEELQESGLTLFIPVSSIP